MSDPLDYTTLDFEALLARTTADVLATPGLEGLDLSPTSPDAYLLRALAQSGSRLAYLLNRYANEAFLTRAILRRSVIDHAGGLGYRLAGATPAVTTLTLAFARAYPDPTPIAAGSRVTTEDGAVTYETTAPAVMGAFATTLSVAAVEGRSVDFATAGVSALAAPGGQSVALSEPASAEDGEFLWGAERVWVAGDLWARVDHFLSSTSTDRHYTVDVDAAGRATLRFGDGTNGLRPGEAVQILVRYRVGGGVRGRVRRGRLTRWEGGLTTDGSQAVDFTVTNGDSSGGTDRETIAHARIAAPASVRATSRTIAREDYELHAMQVSGVARALCHTRNQDDGIAWLTHRLYIVPVDGGTASPALLAAVAEQLTTVYPHGDLDLLDVRAAVYETAAVAASLEAEYGTDGTALQAAAIAAVTALFDPVAVDRRTGRYVLAFARTVPRSRIIQVLQDLPGVRRVVLSSPSVDAVLSPARFPALAATPSIAVAVDAEP